MDFIEKTIADISKAFDVPEYMLKGQSKKDQEPKEYTYEAASLQNPRVIFDERLKRHRKRGNLNYLIVARSQDLAERELDNLCFQMQAKNKKFTRLKKHILITNEKLIAEVK